MADVFVSYARKDREFVLWLTAALTEQGRDVWVDTDDIPPSAEWMTEIRAAIDAATAVVFVVSPDSLNSSVCAQELAHIEQSSKRLVPVVCREPEPTAVPESIGSRNWVMARPDDDRGKALADIARALDTDLDWVRDHTHLLRQATAWEQGGRRRTALLRGADLEETEQVVAANVQREPRLADVQAQFLLASRQAATRRQRSTVGVAGAVALVVAILAVLAVVQRSEAVQQRDRADEEAARAEDRARAATAAAIAARIPTIDAEPDTALLLAVEANRLDNTADTRNALAAAVRRRPELIGYLRAGDGDAGYTAAAPGGIGEVIVASEAGVDRWNVDEVEATAHEPGPAVDLAASADGSVVAVALADGRVEVRPAGPTLEPPSGNAVHVAVSADGSQVAIGTDDGTAAVFTATVGALAGPPVDNGTGRVFVTFGQPGELVTGGNTGEVEVVDIASGARRRTSAGGIGGPIVSLSASGSLVAVGTLTTSMVVESTSGDVVQLPIGSPLIPLPTDGGIVSENPAVIGPAPPDGPGTNVAFSADGSLILVADRVGLRAVPTVGGPAIELDARAGPVRDLAVAADGTVVIVGTRTVLWSLGARQGLRDRVYDSSVLDEPLRPASGPLITGQLSPDGTTVVMTSALAVSRVVDAQSGEPLGPLLTGYARYEDDDTLVAGTPTPYTLRRLRVPGDEAIGAILDLRDFAIIAFAASSRRDQLALAGLDGEVRIAASPTGEIELRTLVTAPPAGSAAADVNSVAFDTSDTTLAIAAGSGLTIVNVATGDVERTVDLGGQTPTAVAFSPDGALLAVGTEAGPIVVLDATTYEPDGLALQGHATAVVEVAFRDDSGLLASMAEDATVRLWDVPGRQRLGEPLPTITTASLSPVHGGTVSFSADGRLLLAPSDAGLAAWQTEPADWAATACRIANRNLTPAEWDAYFGDMPYHATCS